MNSNDWCSPFCAWNWQPVILVPMHCSTMQESESGMQAKCLAEPVRGLGHVCDHACLRREYVNVMQEQTLSARPRAAQCLPIVLYPRMFQQSPCIWALLWIFVETL